MQRLEVSGAVRLIYKSLGVRGLKDRNRHRYSNCQVDVSHIPCVMRLVYECRERLVGG